jgi:hypothetical protein
VIVEGCQSTQRMPEHWRQAAKDRGGHSPEFMPPKRVIYKVGVSRLQTAGKYIFK